MRKLLYELAAIGFVVAGVYVYVQMRSSAQYPIEILQPVDKGLQDCFVKEDTVPYQGKMVRVTGLNCPMENEYPSMFMSFKSKDDIVVIIEDGDLYKCRVFEHFVLWHYWFRHGYSFEACLYVGKKHPA